MIDFSDSNSEKSIMTAESVEWIEYHSPNNVKFSQLQEGIEFDKPSSLGYTFYIIQYKEILGRFGNKTWIDPELFEAVLLDPERYVRAIAKNGYSGYIMKKHPNSGAIMMTLWNDCVKKYGVKNV